MIKERYENGDYIEKNPSWHIEDSPWKANHIFNIIIKNKLNPKTVCEIGCGAGEILNQLQLRMNEKTLFYGYEISPQAIELCKKRTNEKLKFELKDITKEKNIHFDLILIMDVIEHLENYFDFLKKIKPMSKYKILHIPIEINLLNLIRNSYTTFRENAGHIHFFTKDMIIKILEETGYEIIDYFFTDNMDLPNQPLIFHILSPGRRLTYKINKELATRICGGYSLMVLIK